MPRRTTLQHTLIAALAASAVAASPALAQPADRADRFDSPTSSLAGTSSPAQDLRGEYARDAARAAEMRGQPGQPSWPNPESLVKPAKAGPPQDLRGEYARDAARAAEMRVQPGQPTWPMNPEPLVKPAAAVPAPETGGEDDVWLLVGIGLAATGIAAGATGAARRHRLSAPRGAALIELGGDGPNRRPAAPPPDREPTPWTTTAPPRGPAGAFGAPSAGLVAGRRPTTLITPRCDSCAHDVNSMPPGTNGDLPMTHIRTLTRPLVAALAILALAAPPTLAGPGEPGGVDAAAGSQELARLKAGFGTPSWAGSTPASPTDDTQAGETGPVYWSYDYEAPAPEAARSLNADDGGPGGTAVAAGLTGACLLLGAAAAMAGRIRLRARRGRIAA